MESPDEKAARSHNRAVKIVLSIIVGLVALAAIIPTTTWVMEVDEADLQEYADDGDAESLVEFIKDNHTDKTKTRILVPLAIMHIGRRHMTSGILELEEMYYSANDESLRAMILSGLASVGATFPSFERLWSEYYSGISVGDASGQVFNMLKIFPHEKTLPKLISAIDSSLMSDDVVSASTLLEHSITILPEEEATVAGTRQLLIELRKIIDDRNKLQEYVEHSSQLLREFESSEAAIHHFAVKRRFDSAADGRGIYEVISLHTYERAALIAPADQIPPSTIDRMNVQLVVVSLGEQPFQMQDPYGNAMRTEYVTEYETVQKFKDIPQIQRNLPRMKRLFERGAPQFKKDTKDLMEAIRNAAPH